MKPVGLTVTVDAPMPEAQDRILGRVDDRLRSAGLTGREKNGAVDYRPKFIGLVIVWTVRRLQDEHVTFTFAEQGPVTEVRVAGRLRDRAHAEVTEALGGR